MLCPECRTDNPEFHRFCHACGMLLLRQCSSCKMQLSAPDDYCPACRRQIAVPSSIVTVPGERKHVTVMFSDLSGYTAMSEKLDPEDVKEIMACIFGHIAAIVERYDGVIDKLIGDAAMILFGIPRIHEDDAVRAILAAIEIHRTIERMSPEYEAKIGQSLAMHTGINTGLVVTGKNDTEDQEPGITGDAVNVAARLEGLAEPGEILVGPGTWLQARGRFSFHQRPPTRVKGKTLPVKIYRLGQAQNSETVRAVRFQVRAEMIGRNGELEQMRKVVDRLCRNRQGAVICIQGDAGTGKSRLVEELQGEFKPGEIDWYVGNAYAYTADISYALFTDLLMRAFDIDENLSSDSVAARLKKGLTGLGMDVSVFTVLGELLSISRMQPEELDPELRKKKLFCAVDQFLRSLAAKRPTIVCFEDLHWVDPSSAELIHYLLSESNLPVVVVIVQRPEAKPLIPESIRIDNDRYYPIDLKELSGDQMHAMTESLLDSDQIPAELVQFVRTRIDGNPFYLEEVVNTLIDSNRLVAAKDGWRLTLSLSEADMPSTIQGVIAGRLDRLDPDMKRILQEASVIGRVFYYAILKKISMYADRIDTCLNGLQLVDLIKIRERGYEIEYLFKHALTHEVLYNGLLKKERKQIHAHIARVMERVFHDRMPEYYEALAFHYRYAHNCTKAVEYLLKSGNKSLKRYALDESHRYYSQAFDLLGIRAGQRNAVHDCLLIDLINQWAFVFYYRGRYRELLQLLQDHESIAEALNDGRRLGMLRAWLGCALWHREKFSDAYLQLMAALHCGEEYGSRRIAGYASCWLTWICTELGMMKAALEHAENARVLYRGGDIDRYIFINALAGKGYAYWHMGRRQDVHAVGQELMTFARERSDQRGEVMGHCCLGWAQLLNGDLDRASKHFKSAQSASTDPWFAIFPKLALCYGYISGGQIEQADQLIQKILTFSRERGAEFAGTPAYFFNGVLLITRGRAEQGVRLLERQLQRWKAEGCKLRYAACGPILASVYAGIARKAGPFGKDDFTGNLGFLLRRVPFAARKASAYYRAFVAAACEIGATATAGQAYLDWGMLYRSKKRTSRARTCFESAIDCFEKCQVEGRLQQAKEALASLQTD